MPRKVKQRQKQRQKQSQTVIVNIHKNKRSKRQEQPRPPPTPQFIPYPVPQLRGPEPMVTSQPSLVQLLEALRPIQAPVVAPAPAEPGAAAAISDVVAEGKEEVGSHQVVGPQPPLQGPSQPLVSASPVAASSSSSSASAASSSSSSSSSSESSPIYTYDSLNKLNVKDGPNNLMDMATRLGIVGRHSMSKQALILAILRRNPQPDYGASPLRRTIPRPRTSK